MTLRIGAKLPNSGTLPFELGIPAMARALEAAGFASVWVSDHVVMPATIGSRYPFAADGRATWSPETPYVDALLALAMAAAVTERVELGTAVLVLPLRQPVIVAKELASLDAVSRGRLQLGVGAGWLREEFDALNVPFDSRGRRFEEWITILRSCWTGRPDARASEHYDLPADILALPTPAREIPVLVGGHSKPALRRAGAFGDGWLGQQSLNEIDVDEIGAARAAMRAAADAAGRSPEGLRVVLRIVDSAGRGADLAGTLPRLAAAGVDEVIVDLDWQADPSVEFQRLAAAVA